MKIFHLLFILIIGSSSTPLLQIFNTLLDYHGFAHSAQVPTCLNQTQQKQLLMVFEKFSKKGAEAASTTLPSVIDFLQNEVKKNLAENSYNCLNNCHDVWLILNSYQITKNNIESTFKSYAKQNFLTVHYIFTNLTQSFLDENYENVSFFLHTMGKIVYSSTIGNENQFNIRVQNVQKLSEYFGVSVSNGLIGAVSSKSPLRLSQTVLAGTYDKMGRGRVDNIAETFSALNLGISFNGQGLSYYNYVQELNMKEGSMGHSMSSGTFSLSYKYYTLKNLPHIFYTEVSVGVLEDGELVVNNIQEAPSYLNEISKNYEDIDTRNKVYSVISTTALTKSGKIQLAIASSFLLDNDNGVRLLHENWDTNLHLLKLKKSLKKGDSFKFAIATCLISSSHADDTENEAIRLVIRASSMTDILSNHVRKWNQLWESDIIIEGNDEDQKNVRIMLYHCYSFINEWRTYGISPMGLSGLGYNGHVFWDMDLWIYPPILLLHHQLGKSLIEYRFERLQKAKQNAYMNGYSGAMYPWQSSVSGQEETPVWALPGPLQHHISGCVAFAAWNYFCVTQDVEWLRNKGYEMIRSVAQFYESRVQKDKQGKYHIYNVVGADQWAENVDDDAFTNAIAIATFEIANKVNKILNYTINEKWEELRQNVVILKMESNVTKQHSTYVGESIKQADANLLSFPLKYYTQSSDILRDLQYYEGRIPDEGTPAMTYSIFTILYSRLNNSDKAYSNFKQSHQDFFRKPFNVMAETKKGSNPYFLTGAGGVLQSMIFGFGGFDITEKGIIKIKSAIPKQWKSVTIKVKGGNVGVQGGNLILQ